jgi:hypothetical protein
MAVSLVWGISAPGTGWGVPPNIALLRIGYFLVLAIACTAMAGATGRKGSIRELAGALLPAGAPLAVLAGVVALSPGLPLVRAIDANPVCSRAVPDVQVCLGSDDRSLLPDVVRTARTTVSLIPPTNLVLAAPRSAHVTSGGPEIALPDIVDASTHSGFDQQVARAFAIHALSAADCPGNDYRYAVLSRVLVEAGAQPEEVGIFEETGKPSYGRGYERLAMLSRREFAAWLDEYLPHLRDCSLRDEDLP